MERPSNFGDLKKKYTILLKKRQNVKQVFGYHNWPVRIIYKQVVLDTLFDHSPALICYDNPQREDAEILVDFVSFLSYIPSFVETNSKELNEKLSEIYFYSPVNVDKGFKLNLKLNEDEVVEIKDIFQSILLALYNTALKQPEPLARCVFYFRIIEYCYFNLENFRSQRPRLTDYVEQLYQKAVNHNYMPLYIDPSPFVEDKTKRKTNLIVIWKRKSKRIKSKWNKLNIKIGEEIYNTGRCGIAHAKGGNDPIIFHDYSNDYKRILDINIFLELIARYLIERENPQWRNFIRFKQVKPLSIEKVLKKLKN